MNIANKLTVLRIIAIPFVVALMLTNHMTAALILFALAAFTDALDGYLARKLNIITTLGKFMDPLADKLLVLSSMMVFVEQNVLFSWAVIIIFSRELMISIFRAIAASSGVVIAAAKLGKMKTVSQMVLVLYLYLASIFGWYSLIWDELLIGVAVVMTVLSGAEYLWKNRQVLKETK